MITRISLLAMGLAVMAVPAVAGGNKIKTVPTEPVACEGVFGPESSEALVKQTFGAENVVTGTVHGPEGMEILATTVFPDDPERRLQFVWWDEENFRYASYVELARSQEQVNALSQENVELKSRVGELEKIQQDSSKLIALKDSELADAQQRLAELEASQQSAASSASEAPASTTDSAIATDTAAETTPDTTGAESIASDSTSPADPAADAATTGDAATSSAAPVDSVTW